MKFYGRSKKIGFRGVVLDDQDHVVEECRHNHPTRASAERCGRDMKERRAQNQNS